MATEMHECDACVGTYTFDELGEIKDYRERVDPGGVAPSGECPAEDCGALCYPVDDQRREVDAQFAALQALHTFYRHSLNLIQSRSEELQADMLLTDRGRGSQYEGLQEIIHQCQVALGTYHHKETP